LLVNDRPMLAAVFVWLVIVGVTLYV